MRNATYCLKDIDNGDVVDLVDDSMRNTKDKLDLFNQLMSDLSAWGKEIGYEITITKIQQKSA